MFKHKNTAVAHYPVNSKKQKDRTVKYIRKLEKKMKNFRRLVVVSPKVLAPPPPPTWKSGVGLCPLFYQAFWKYAPPPASKKGVIAHISQTLPKRLGTANCKKNKLRPAVFKLKYKTWKDKLQQAEFTRKKKKWNIRI